MSAMAKMADSERSIKIDMLEDLGRVIFPNSAKPERLIGFA